MVKVKFCGICGSNKIVKQKCVETFEYKGQKLKVEDYSVFKCNTCGEEFVDEAYLKTIELRLRDFHRSVDGLLTSKEIKEIRKSLGFSQEKLGELLGGGKKAFARYENGTVCQSKPMDNLLRLLRDDPYARKKLQPQDNVVKSPVITGEIGIVDKRNIYKFSKRETEFKEEPYYKIAFAS